MCMTRRSTQNEDTVRKHQYKFPESPDEGVALESMAVLMQLVNR